MPKIPLPSVHTIYLDMDGPLVNDVKMFAGLDLLIPDMKAHLATLKIFGLKQAYVFPLIEEAILKNRFLSAEKTSFAEIVKIELLPFWKEKGINVEILSSTMHVSPHRASLTEQKQKWLAANGFGHLKVNLVPGSAEKQKFAQPGTLLIDDYDRTIGQFISAGGYGIQYVNLNETLAQLRLIGLAPTAY